MIQFLKNFSGSNQNLAEAINISCDFQIGSYIKYWGVNQNKSYGYTLEIAGIINRLDGFSSITEAGFGENTTMEMFLIKLAKNEIEAYRFNFTWPHLNSGFKFLENRKLKTNLLISDLCSILFRGYAFDVEYSSHSIESSREKEKEVPLEFYQVTLKYLILINSMYKLVSEEAKKGMEFHSYMREIKERAEKLGMKVVSYRHQNSLQKPPNPTELILIKKNVQTANIKNPYMCPYIRTALIDKGECYFSEENYFYIPKKWQYYFFTGFEFNSCN